jgi:hypothetical protein
MSTVPLMFSLECLVTLTLPRLGLLSEDLKPITILKKQKLSEMIGEVLVSKRMK